VLRIAAIPLAYELDGLTVFFARIAGTGREFFAAFVFAAHADGGWRFLPSQPDRPAFVLLRGWFDASWGPAHADIPTYCGSDLVARATHTASLGGWPGTLWLRGAAIDGAATDPAATGARAAVEQLKQAGAAGADGVSNLSARMTPQGGARFSRWLAAATPGDRAAYTGQFAALRPFFVFDASPLLVVYARTAAGRIEVLYFTRSEQGDLLWANASQMSSVDRAFKRDPLYAAANAETPFGPLAIRRDAR
jgi:hypothetical protein